MGILGTAGGIGSESAAFRRDGETFVHGATFHLLAIAVLVVLLALWWWDRVRSRA